MVYHLDLPPIRFGVCDNNSNPAQRCLAGSVAHLQPGAEDAPHQRHLIVHGPGARGASQSGIPLCGLLSKRRRLQAAALYERQQLWTAGMFL